MMDSKDAKKKSKPLI